MLVAENIRLLNNTVIPLMKMVENPEKALLMSAMLASKICVKIRG